MADGLRYAPGAQLNVKQLIDEAQHRWLRPAEICEILQNYRNFQISAEPPYRPSNGSLYLFDRKVLRYFRKDGHNWRKKRDGKTVKEAHERLKAGSVDVLHCYYAHGEENENFQRRSYWMLEEERSHIVLVHYREVKGNRTNLIRSREATEPIPDAQETEDDIRNSEAGSCSTSKFHPYDYQVASQVTDTASLNSAQASEYGDAESAYNHQSSSSFHTYRDLQPPVMQKAEDRHSLPVPNTYQVQFPGPPNMGFDPNATSTGAPYMPEGQHDFSTWRNVIESGGLAGQPINFQTSQVTNSSMMHGLLQQVLTDSLGTEAVSGSRTDGLGQWQTSEGDPLYISKWPMDQKLHLDSANKLVASSSEDNIAGLHNSLAPYNVLSANQNTPQNDLPVHLGGANAGNSSKPAWNSNQTIEGKADYPTMKQVLLDGVLEGGLKKLDSFDRWMSRELGDVNDSHIQSSSTNYWESVGNEDDNSNITPPEQIDSYMMGPSLSQDQLFSIIDFAPNWAFSGSEVKVLISGRFLKSQEEAEKCNWACMFGELEVPAEVIANGVLRCSTPLHEPGRVPFYVTCSNRCACSEVREFEFRISSVQNEDVAVMSSVSSEESHLLIRFTKLLTAGSLSNPTNVPGAAGGLSHLTNKVDSSVLDDENEWACIQNLISEDKFSVKKVKDQLLQKLLRDKLHLWLIQKVAEDGKGPLILDEGGQGVLHFAAALGYDWAIPPTIAGGVSVNFRDVNGWTALHWAASYGRERTVASLISLDANPGALTDPTPKYPSGRTPADLAYSNGHKGIAGYLAESALSSHLSTIELKDKKDGQDVENSELKAVQTITERTATPSDYGDLPHGLSMKDSLAALRNATQAAARIHQVFRVQSFQRKQIKEYGDGGSGISDERALSLLAMRSNRAGHPAEPVHAAAIRIQNKFRGWKGRKEFLLIRQRIIKIQAHVRGHQVRKNYKKIIWSVGILDKVILRWRRKGSGLRGFKSEAITEGSGGVERSSKEDDYDFLKEGRKQTEDRLQKALARVKSMVQYPEARDQYRRLLNVVSEMQETKTKYDRLLNNSDETAADFDDDLIDIDALLEDDTSMAASSST
ncbi:hypothetical protein M9H77_19730 [Catharanthus roseus]|uniref:Uncharacterized protein n=1 Tax=Catharanthus roseus TaxID=4058 RepID=A0ACC0BB83_CATRO|nr:hypothetical protein M9H77_19730 [Catharanthus roseus]